MAKRSVSPFDTIESAHSFVQFLSSTLAETKKEVAADVDRQSGDTPNRRRDALLVAIYNLERLEYHLTRSARLLNDLRSIRRLILEERTRTANGSTVQADSAHAIRTEEWKANRGSLAISRKETGFRIRNAELQWR